MRTQEEHIENRGQVCPNCGSGETEGSQVTIDDGRVYQPMACLECRATWTDCYALVGYRDLVEPVMLGIYDHSGNRIDEVQLVRVAPADPEVFIAGYLKGFLADGHTCYGDADWFDRNVPGWRPLREERQEACNVEP